MKFTDARQHKQERKAFPGVRFPGLFLPEKGINKKEIQSMKRKTYSNVLKAGKLIQKKGYKKQESLEMAVKLFDDLEALKNDMSVEWLVDKLQEKE